MRKKKKTEEVQVKSLKFPDENGGMTAIFSHSAISEMAAHFVKLFKEAGGINYVEWTMEDKKSPEVGPFTVMIQRREGMTASEKASKYKAALEKIKAMTLVDSPVWAIANAVLESI
jgi:uncharacterized protein YbaA (DUF1428 family)